jgi:hypothetical protein
MSITFSDTLNWKCDGGGLVVIYMYMSEVRVYKGTELILCEIYDKQIQWIILRL